MPHSQKIAAAVIAVRARHLFLEEMTPTSLPARTAVRRFMS